MIEVKTFNSKKFIQSFLHENMYDLENIKGKKNLLQENMKDFSDDEKKILIELYTLFSCLLTRYFENTIKKENSENDDVYNQILSKIKDINENL